MRKARSDLPIGSHNSKPAGSGKEVVTKLKPPVLTAQWSDSLVAPFSFFEDKKKQRRAPPTKVAMWVQTEQVPDNVEVCIEIRHAQTKALVKNSRQTGFKTRGGKVIDPLTGKPPTFEFRAEHLPWDVWDFPYFYFVAEMQYLGKKFIVSSPHDPRKDLQHLLRVAYWHVIYCDGKADQRDELGITKHSSEIRTILDRPMEHQALHRVSEHPHRQEWCHLLSNAYSYYHVGHGELVNGKSALILGSQELTAAAVRDKKLTPSVPRYLVYLNSCKVGAEQSLASSFIERGAGYVLAFEIEIGVDAATKMARAFYNRWAMYDFNPDKIESVFYEVSSTYASLRPRLFMARRTVSARDSAGTAVQSVAPGALTGSALYLIIKPNTRSQTN